MIENYLRSIVELFELISETLYNLLFPYIFSLSI